MKLRGKAGAVRHAESAAPSVTQLEWHRKLECSAHMMGRGVGKNKMSQLEPAGSVPGGFAPQLKLAASLLPLRRVCLGRRVAKHFTRSGSRARRPTPPAAQQQPTLPSFPCQRHSCPLPQPAQCHGERCFEACTGVTVYGVQYSAHGMHLRMQSQQVGSSRQAESGMHARKKTTCMKINS